MDDLLKPANEQTPARVALGTTGVSLPTRSLLAFQMDHALARDAVHESLATLSLVQELATLRTPAAGLTWTSDETLTLHSAAPDRETYLRRPDLGRRLAGPDLTPSPCDLAIVLADGLSALAVNRHALPLLVELCDRLAADTRHWAIGPIAVVQQGRVAIGDAIGEQLHAAMVLMLIGERPGLSAPDSLGAYLTWHPRIGRTDAERNCISNIRPEGLAYKAAAHRIAACITAATRQQLTGVALGQSKILSS
jgi:ethanolamine ammonia-lyase small subunit